MLLRLFAVLGGAISLFFALQLARGNGGVFKQTLADGRSLARAPSRLERICLGFLFGLSAAWLFGYAVLPTRDRVEVELYAGAAITLVACLANVVIVLNLPSDRVALSQGQVARDDETTIEIPTSGVVIERFDQALPLEWRKVKAVTLMLIGAVGSTLILLGLLPTGVIEWLEDADAAVTSFDMAVTGAILALVVGACAVALIVGILSWNLGLAGGSAAILMVVAALLALGALTGATQDLWDTTRDLVTCERRAPDCAAPPPTA
jgi:hypothetical protein